MANQVFVDFVLRGLEGFAEASKQIRALEQSAKGLGNLGSGTENAAKGLKSVADEAARSEKSILAHAKAQAALAKEQGRFSDAVAIFQQTLSRLTAGTVTATNAERELARAQNQLAASVRRSDNEIASQATLFAKIEQNAGSASGALKTITDAQAKLANPKGVAAARLELRKTYLETNYANSPLIGTLQQINSQFDRFLPIIGTVSPRLAQFVGIAQKAAGAFQTTGEATRANTGNAATFLDVIKRAGQAVSDFGKDQGGTASFTDALLDLSKIASNVGERIRAVFARIKEAAINAFTNLKQGKNPFSDLFSGSKATGGATADTAKIAANLGEVQTAASGAAEAVGEIGAAGAGATLAVGGLVAGVLALAAGVAIIAGIAAGLKQIGEDGIAANRQLEGLRIGIASVINGVGTISKDGIELKGADAFNAALKLANDQVAKIKEEASGLGLPVQETAEAFQTTIGPLTQFGLGLDDARKTSLNIVVAMQSLGIPLREAGQEARAILQGQTDRTARLNQILRITKEELKAAKERGQVQELLNQRLAGFAAGGTAFAQSFDGSIARAQARIKTFEGGVTEGLFNTIRDRLNAALNGIAKNGGIAATFSGLGDTLTNIFNRASDAVGPLFDFILNGVKTVSDFLGQNQGTVDKIIESVAIIIEQVVDIGTDLLKTIGISNDWGKSVDTVSLILKGAAVFIAILREQFNLVTHAVVAVGAAIGFAMLKPLELALKAIAVITSVIPGVGRVAQGITDIVSNTIASLDKAAKNNGRAVVNDIKNFGTAGASAIKQIDEASSRFAAKRKADVAKSKVDTTGLTFTGKPPTDDEKDKKKAAANTEASLKQLREAEFALKKAFADRDVALAKAEAETQNRILDQQLEDRQISLESFYAEKAKLVEQDRQREIRAINDSIAAEREKLAEINSAEQRQLATETAKPAKQRKVGEVDKIRTDAEVERLKTLAKIVDLETKLSEAELKGDATTAQNTRNRIKALRDLQGQVAGVSVDLARATGDDLTAALAEIDAKFNDTLKVFIANFGEQSAEVQKLLGLIGLQKQGAKAQFTVSFDTANASRDFAESDVQKQVTAGLLSEAQARQRLLDIQRAYAQDTLPLIRKQIEELENLAKAEIAASPAGEGSSQTRAKILELQRKEQDILRATIDPFFAEVKRGLTQDLRGSFEQFLLFSKGGLEDLKGLALGFIDGIKRAISKVLSEQIEKKFIDPFVNKLFGTLGLGGGTDPAQLANTVATNANTAAITGLTAAVSAQGVTGQFSIGSNDNGGISLPGIGGDGGAQQGSDAGDAVSGPGGALNNFFDKIKSGFEKFANSLKSIATGIGHGIKSIFGAIVGGISSVFGSLFGGGGGGASAGGGGGGGFAEGGFTGAGARFEPAGVVHRGEFVQPANVVNRFGVGFMEAMRVGAIQPEHFNFNERLLAGFSPRRSSFLAEGGLPLAPPSSSASGSGGGAAAIRNVVLFNDSDVAAALASAEGEKVVFTHLQRRKNEIKQLLGLKQ